MSNIISADEIKKTLPNYSPESVEKLHLESTKIADKLFKQGLKDDHIKEVILMCGGAASGKSEFVSEYLTEENYLIYDGTLSEPEGAKVKIRNCIRKHKKVSIYAVLPNDISKAFVAFLNRDRKFSDAHFYRTHTGCRKTLLFVAESYPNVKIKIHESIFKNNDTYFVKLKFSNKNELIKYLKDKQYTEQELLDIINST
jgi:hypothetical protein